jgi:hypothetical protein
MSVYRVHRHGVWSGLDLTRQTKMALDVLAALQGHFQGEYQEHIEASRLKICQRLIDQLQASRTACEHLQSQVQFLQQACDAHAERERRQPWPRLKRNVLRTTRQILDGSLIRQRGKNQAA